LFVRGQSPLQSPSANNYGQQVIGLDQKGTEMQEQDVYVAINTQIINKNENKKNLGEGWVSSGMQIEGLAKFIEAGMAYCATMKSESRNAKNFMGSNLVSIDIDKDRTISEALSDPFSQKHLSMFYPTASHTEQEHRFRLVFKLPRFIENPTEYKTITRALQLKYGGDPNAIDVSRIFYGNSRASVQTWERSIPEDVLKNLLSTYTLPQSDGHSNITGDASLISRQTIDPDKELITKSGQRIKLSDVEFNTSIYCPNHNDKHPSAFANKKSDGGRYVFCSTCKASWHDSDRRKVVEDKYEFVKVMREVTGLTPEKRIDRISDVSQLFDHEKMESPRIFFSNTKHLELSEIKPGLTLIRSPKGSGKTESMVDVVKKAIYNKRQLTLGDFEELEPDDESVPQRIFERTKFRVLLIGHRRALIRNLCERLDLFCYLDDLDKSKFQISESRINHYGVCFDSIEMVSFTSQPYDLVIVDEVEQVLAHLLSSTVRNPIGFFNAFKQLISNAKSVVALDADLDWTSYLTLSSIRASKRIDSKNNSLTVYINEYKSDGKEIEIYQNKRQLIGALLQDIEQGRKIYFSSNSKKRIDSTYEAIKKEYPDVTMIKVTSENSNDEDTQTFITNAAFESLKYQVVLASPSIGTGVDITFPDDKEIFQAVYGIYEPLVNTHTDMDQQLSRVRHPEKVKVWISPRTFNFETEFAVIRSDLLMNHVFANTTVGISSKKHSDVFSEPNEFLRFSSLVVSNQRKSKNQLKDNFIDHKVQNGWTVLKIEDKDLASKGKDFELLGFELEQKHYIEKLINSAPVDRTRYKNIKDNMDLGKSVSDEDRWSFVRMRVELFFRKQISEELILEFDRGKLTEKRWRYSHTIDTNGYNEWVRDAERIGKDEIKGSLKVIKDKHEAVGSYLLRDIFRSTPIFDGNEFRSDVEFELEDLHRFVKITKNLKPFMEAQIKGVTFRKDLETNPVQQLGDFLKLVGLEHTKSRKQNAPEGKRITYYKITQESLDMMVALEMLHKDPVSPWIEINERYGFVDEEY